MFFLIEPATNKYYALGIVGLDGHVLVVYTGSGYKVYDSLAHMFETEHEDWIEWVK